MGATRARWARSAARLGVVAAIAACAPPAGTRGEKVAPAQARDSIFAHRWVWTDETGGAVTLARWRGTPLVVTAVYTTCASTCPLTVDKLRRIHDAFRRQGRQAEFILVTLDPATDTPERLGEFKARMKLPDSWHLLRGGPDATRDLTDMLDVHVMDMDPHLVHDARIMTFDRQGMPVLRFTCCNFEEDAALL